MFLKANYQLKAVHAAIALLAALTLSNIAFAQKWNELKPDEQKTLAPFQKEWDSMSPERKKKW
ncbi:MAG: DUF3106 domain-containing protein, partial [Casimicrobium sp.]